MCCAFIEIMATVIEVLWDYSFSRARYFAFSETGNSRGEQQVMAVEHHPGGSGDFQICGFSPFSDTVHSKLLIFFHRDDQS